MVRNKKTDLKSEQRSWQVLNCSFPGTDVMNIIHICALCLSFSGFVKFFEIISILHHFK